VSIGFITVKPRDAEKAKGFRGIVFLFPGADQVIRAYEEMGGPSEALVEMRRFKDGHAIDIQIYEPPLREDGHDTTP